MFRKLISLKTLIWAIVLLVVGIVGWGLLVVNTVATVKLPSGTTSYKITSAYSGKQIAHGTSSGIVRLAREDYLVRYYKDTLVVGVKFWHPSALPFAGLQPANVTTASNHAVPVFGDAADYATPLGKDSYIYLNRQTKAVTIADATGLHDISKQCGLSTTNAGVYDMVVNILPGANDTAIVTTTRAVYVVSSATNVVRFEPYTPGFTPNFYGSAYDNETNSVFVLNTYDKTIYRYQLSNPFGGMQTFLKSSNYIQSISAANGRLVLYGGNMPSSDPAALQQYAKRYQMTPLIIDTSSKQRVASLGGYEDATTVLPSDKGTFVAIKRKFATTLDIYNYQTKQTVTIPANDVSGLAWLDGKLFIGRDNGLWTYTAGDTVTSLLKVADTGANIVRLTPTKDTITVSTLSGVTQSISLGDTSEATTPTLGNLSLSAGSDYSISFSAIDKNIILNTQSFAASRGETLSSAAQNTAKAVHAAFPDSTYITTVNQRPNPGVYAYASQ